MKVIEILKNLTMFVILLGGIWLAFIGARGTGIHYYYAQYGEVYAWGVLILAGLGTWKLIDISNQHFDQWKAEYPAIKAQNDYVKKENYRRNHMTAAERKEEIEKQLDNERRTRESQRSQLEATREAVKANQASYTHKDSTN